MSLLPYPSLLDQILGRVPRRYRLPATEPLCPQAQAANPATMLAGAIEQGRRALARGEVPNVALRRLFTESLAHMIHEAMHAEFGEPRFQAMVLRHGATQVNEYATLSADADHDRRRVLAAVDAIAHPAKQQRSPPGRQREALAQLYTLASDACWSELAATAQRLSDTSELASESPFKAGLIRVLESSALARLRRLDALASDDIVRQYQSLLDRDGPRSGSTAAVAQGSVSQRRGAAAERWAARAIEALARRLNEAEGTQDAYRVVTSMRVPPSIPGSAERAKSEWDAVLLRHAGKMGGATQVWDVCLLVEAKASVDAATTDLPKLLRGLRLLAHAEEHAVYSFKTQQGDVRLRGASLSALATDEASLNRTVLYCCDAPADRGARLLSAASRMQLLSAQASVKFAATLAQKQQAHPQDLEPVWHELLESPRWGAVLNQYPMLRQVRELMVHTEDLLATIKGAADTGTIVGS